MSTAIPLATRLRMRADARATLYHLEDLHSRHDTWTEAERFEAQYSPQRAATARRILVEVTLPWH